MCDGVGRPPCRVQSSLILRMVHGELVVDEGKLKGELPGRSLIPQGPALAADLR